MVVDYVKALKVPSASRQYLHFARIDCVDCFDELEGILFYRSGHAFRFGNLGFF